MESVRQQPDLCVGVFRGTLFDDMSKRADIGGPDQPGGEGVPERSPCRPARLLARGGGRDSAGL
jgi:hypothetical protein